MRYGRKYEPSRYRYKKPKVMPLEVDVKYMSKTVYRDKDLIPDFWLAVQDAAWQWRHMAADYVKENGDQGSCVVGAGIAIQYQPPRYKSPVELMIISAPGGQGSCTWESSLPSVLGWLHWCGIDAYYAAGRMD